MAIHWLHAESTACATRAPGGFPRRGDALVTRPGSLIPAGGYPCAVLRSSTAVACLDFASELRAMAAECRRVADQLEASCPAERRRSLAYHLLAARIPRPEIVATLVSRCGCSTSAAQAAIRDALDRRTKDLSRGG